MFLRILLFCICLITYCNAALADTAPFPGGAVTSPFGEANHFGHTHAGADIGTLSGTRIYAPKSGIVEHGAGSGFIYWCMITFDDGGCLFFGDCDEATLNYDTGRVSEGEIIGITGGDEYDGPLGRSTGPHTHVEYWPNGYYSGYPENPCPILISMGSDLTGNVLGEGGFGTGGHGGSGGGFGADDIALPWRLDLMYTLGDSFNSTIQTFVDGANTAFKNLFKLCLGLLIVLAIIDMTLPILLSGMGFSGKKFIVKFLKYAFLIFVFINWNTIINDGMVKLISTFSGTYTGNSDIIAANMSQPQLLFQKCVFMLTPGLNIISSFSGLTFIKNFGPGVLIMLMTFITMAIYFMVALYVSVVYIDFYITAALNIMTLPFSTFGFTKFIAEGSAGHLLTSALKLVFISIMIAFAVVCIQDAKPGAIFTATRVSGVTVDSITNYTVMCMSLVALAAMIITIPSKLADKIGGPVEIPK
jgi:hypothetical protein